MGVYNGKINTELVEKKDKIAWWGSTWSNGPWWNLEGGCSDDSLLVGFIAYTRYDIGVLGG